MKWLAFILLISSAPVFSQTPSKDFLGGFGKAAGENVPGQDTKFTNFSFIDDGDPKISVNFTPKKIMPVTNISKLPFDVQTKLKIKPNDGKDYYFLNYLEEANLTNASGKEFKGPASVSRMIRKNPSTNEVEFLYANGDWHKILSSSVEMKNLDGMLNQAATDAKLTPLVDAGVRPVELGILLKDPELACKWVGEPRPIKVSTGKFDKKYFCRSQVECGSKFLLNGNELDEGSYEVSCVNDKSDCSKFVTCMQYVEDDDFEILKKSIPASSTHQ